uniref:(northern house mosquito) hypothetical protein n=1 Tax=Culex pipiens TaxID=7175 RepID=A0A8D8BIL0_CULPI
MLKVAICQTSNEFSCFPPKHRKGRKAGRRRLGHLQRELRLPLDRRPLRARGPPRRDRRADPRRHQNHRRRRVSREPAARVLHLRVRVLCPVRLDLRGPDGVLGAAAVRPAAGTGSLRRRGHCQLGAGVGNGGRPRVRARGETDAINSTQSTF